MPFSFFSNMKNYKKKIKKILYCNLKCTKVNLIGLHIGLGGSRMKQQVSIAHDQVNP